MIDSLYYSSRKIPERCENPFVDYRINYQNLCYLMRQITKDLNSATVPQKLSILIKSFGEEALNRSKLLAKMKKKIHFLHVPAIKFIIVKKQFVKKITITLKQITIFEIWGNFMKI